MLEYVGLPVPGESLMMLLGFTRTGKFDTTVSITLAALGTFTGSMFAYTVGYLFGEKVVLKIGKPFHITKQSLLKANAALEKHKAAYIILCRFIPGARHVVPYLSGISRVDAVKNALYNLLSGAIWCASFICLGRFAGSKWHYIGKFVGSYTILALVLIIFIYIVFKYFNRHKVSIITLAVSLIVLTGIIMGLVKNELSPLDNTVYSFISQFINPGLTKAMKFISNFGTFYFLLAAAAVIAAVLLIKRKSRFHAAMTTVNLISVSILCLIFKNIFERARPDINQLVAVHGYSFPSAHSMLSAAFYGYLVYLCAVFLKKPYRQAASAFLILLTLAVGISRIYLGVHYTSDVIGGYMSGLSWLVIFITVSKYFGQKFKNKINLKSVPKKPPSP